MVTLMFSKRRLWIIGALLLMFTFMCVTSAFAFVTTQGFAITFGESEITMPANDNLSRSPFMASLSDAVRSVYTTVTGDGTGGDDVADNNNDDDSNGDDTTSTGGGDGSGTEDSDGDGNDNSSANSGDCLLDINVVCANTDTDNNSLDVNVDVHDTNTVEATISNDPDESFLEIDLDNDGDPEVDTEGLIEETVDDVGDVVHGLFGNDD